MLYILPIVIGYLFGSIPCGYIAGKLAGRDIRQEGYRRIGASNVYSVLGFIPAI
ncbi:MAG: glycerol-3-phosphate acyltransferase, partial [bacterium]|nr:glycerol-3-phosphate acyltransferase [bacterium]